MFGKLENKIIKKGVINEEDLAKLMFDSLISKELVGANKEIKKELYISGFKQRKIGKGFELNNGAEIEQLYVLFQKENNHISLTEINLLSVNQGIDVITYNDKLHFTEVKSSIRKKEISADDIIKKIFESIKSQLCDNKKIANQFLDTIKIIDNSDILKKDIVKVKKSLTDISIGQSKGTNILTFHEDETIKVNSFISCTTDEQTIIDVFESGDIENMLKAHYEKNISENNCIFCNRKDCDTEESIENLTVKYDIYSYRLNDKFDLVIYLDNLIGMIQHA